MKGKHSAKQYIHTNGYKHEHWRYVNTNIYWYKGNYINRWSNINLSKFEVYTSLQMMLTELKESVYPSTIYLQKV